MRRAGLRRGQGAETGTVTFNQRFGSAWLSLNIHLHLLVLDGAYTFTGGDPRFHRARAPTVDELECLLDALIRRIVRTLMRAGVLVADPEEEGGSPYLNLERPDDDALATIEGASVRYRIAVGPIAGRKTLRLQVPGLTAQLGESAKPLTMARAGFSLNASVACRAEERKKLERLCRYVARPPLALGRLGRDGRVVHRLKRAFRDGTTEFLFEPLDFLARLAALVPRPRSHLVRSRRPRPERSPPPTRCADTGAQARAPRRRARAGPEAHTDELDAAPALRVRHRAAPVPALRCSIAHAGGDYRPEGDRRHPRTHRHSRRTRPPPFASS
jgi:hypothetical protein